MYKYYIIVAHDNNTVYKVFGCNTRRNANQSIFYWTDSAFVVCLVSGDCFKYSDNDIVKKARKSKIIEL